MTLMTKQEALNLFQSEKKRHLVEELTDKARVICELFGQVTVDELRKQTSLPAGTDARIYGAVLARKEFKPIGFTTTKRKSSHGRPIRVFALKTEEV